MKEFLSQRGIRFEDRDVSRNRALAQELVSRTGQMGVPVTIVDGQTILGFDRAQLELALARTQRPSLGAAIADASKITAKQGTAVTLGAYIGRVRPGSVAERMGLLAGDIITEMNMQRIASADDLERVISNLSPGSRISVMYLRGSRQLSAEGTF